MLPSWGYTPGIELQLWGPNEDHNDHFVYVVQMRRGPRTGTAKWYLYDVNI